MNHIHRANNDALVFDEGGNDTLGGEGSDNISGNADTDVFKFAAGDGLDVVNDFSRAQGDQLVISSALECFRKSGTRFSEKKHDKAKS